jgi:hypothetical protein
MKNQGSINPSEIVFSITMQSVLSALDKRLGKEALSLSVEDLELAREEVKAAIEHHLDERDYIDIGLDSWDIVRGL